MASIAIGLLVLVLVLVLVLEVLMHVLLWEMLLLGFLEEEAFIVRKAFRYFVFNDRFSVEVSFHFEFDFEGVA